VGRKKRYIHDVHEAFLKEVNVYSMKMQFYDVKTRKKVETEVTEKKEYESRGQIRYAVRGKTSDGRSLTRFISKSEYDKISV
jgi:hypothetical protein